MTMIEKVARALCKAEHDSWDDLPESLKAMFFASARAAIEAMREPTDAMVQAAEENFFEHMPDARDWTLTYAKAAYEAALDAALSEVEQSPAK